MTGKIQPKKKPYFVTADGVSVGGNDNVFCIGVLMTNLNKRVVFRGLCKFAINIVMEDNIFSSRQAAQEYCDNKTAPGNDPGKL